MSQSANEAVPNPQRQALERTLAEVRMRVSILEAALDPVHRQFTGQPTWVGPAARRFADDLSARRVRLRQAAQAIVTTLEEEIRALPAYAPPPSPGYR
ncbi:hypothetical protein [Microtetraspora fusca]|uniref:hypothetical protein n=1 Tax=Microtetraspora fusca TaxID=1997 RepID=UPI000835F506|nr:hypothetical protein [Microtetraspora fusca]